MNLTPEIKQQLAEQKKHCIFCKIVAKEIDSQIVFEDDLTLATLDIHPALKGHMLYFLKEHYPIMPYIPANEFTHLFGLLPQLGGALQDAMASPALNIFIANGAAAGQQSPHFLMHLLPRDDTDNFYNFMFKKGPSLDEAKVNMFAHNLPSLMANHFKKTPASWHISIGTTPAHLTSLQGTTIYEDEKTLVQVPQLQAAPGHVVIYSKEEERDFRNLSFESSAHLFTVASFAATVVFEGLGAQATNILLKSGYTSDHPSGLLEIHILPRTQGDSLSSLHWQPQQPSYDLGSVAKRIKEKNWSVKAPKKEMPKVEEIKVPLMDDDEISKAISKFH